MPVPSDQPTHEDAYFAEQDREARAKLRAQLTAQAEAMARRHELRDALNLDDATLLDHLRKLGIDATTAPALHLLPLVEVAWADGKVTDAERRKVMQAAACAGITPHDPAARYLAALLEEQPDQTLTTTIRGVLRELLVARDLHPHTLLEACEQVAAASGGFFGLAATISTEEHNLLETLANTLDADTGQRVADALNTP